MKKVIVCLSLIFASAAGFSQETTTTPKSTMRMYKVETGATTTNQVPAEKPVLTKEQEIANCKTLLEALDAKEAYIRSNPEELKIAQEAGWFVNAEATRAQLKARLAELESK